MKKAGLICLAFVLCSTSVAQETRARTTQSRRGEVAGYASRDASIMSMMGWGLGLAVGIATLFALLDNNDSSSSSNNGSSGHNH